MPIQKVPGVGIEPTASWFRARRHYRQQLPRIGVVREKRHVAQVRGGRLERPSPGSKPGSLPLADPRECPAGVEPASPAWKAGTSAARPRAQSGRRGSRTPKASSARPLSKRLPSPIGLSFRISSCGGRNRTCAGAVNSRLSVPAQTPPHRSQGGPIRTDDLRLPRPADSQAFLHPVEEHPAGVEPALPPWQGSRLPLHHGCVRTCRIVKDRADQSTGRESNPRCRITGAESCPLDHQCVALSVGPEGLEPSPGRLRAGDAAANTLVPSSCRCLRRLRATWARRESNPRRILIRDLL